MLRPVAITLSAATTFAVAITLWSGDLATTALIILGWLAAGLAVGLYMAD